MHIEEICPSLVCMDCETTYVSSLRDLCELHTGNEHELYFMLSEDIAHA